ncbi:MAG: DUF1320 domain-containing protein [Myxococcales bacterium]|nr:DUF1320 domain-containing protein [Myxococcales bacterium]
MAYCSLTDLIDRFGEREILVLTDRDKDGVADTAVADAAISDASAEIDLRVGQRYRVPVAPTPPILRSFACDIARYRLAGERPHDQIAQRYRDAIASLELIANGQVSLGAGDASLAGQSRVSFSAPAPVFGDKEQCSFMGDLR